MFSVFLDRIPQVEPLFFSRLLLQRFNRNLYLLFEVSDNVFFRAVEVYKLPRLSLKNCRIAE